KGENGYRYYTYHQSQILEMLLTLRELDMSIKDIMKYIKKPSPEKFRNLISTKTAEIDETIKRLKEIRKLLTEKEKQLAMCENSDLNKIELVECNAEYLLLSPSISGTYDDNDMGIFMEHNQRLSDYRLYNKSYGSMILTDKISHHNFDDYDCFFIQVKNPASKKGLFLKEKGTYIRGFSVGDWDKIPQIYLKMLAFADENNLKISGYCYEEGINEMAISSMEQYITQILMPCHKEK
ncbi:MAG: hypothetical protein RSA04_05330, partial [Clostridiales bacterium]